MYDKVCGKFPKQKNGAMNYHVRGKKNTLHTWYEEGVNLRFSAKAVHRRQSLRLLTSLPVACAMWLSGSQQLKTWGQVRFASLPTTVLVLPSGAPISATMVLRWVCMRSSTRAMHTVRFPRVLRVGIAVLGACRYTANTFGWDAFQLRAYGWRPFLKVHVAQWDTENQSIP